MKKEYKPIQFTIVNIEADIIVASPFETTWQPTVSTSEIEPGPIQP